jgi:hypothetical protein
MDFSSMTKQERKDFLKKSVGHVTYNKEISKSNQLKGIMKKIPLYKLKSNTKEHVKNIENFSSFSSFSSFSYNNSAIEVNESNK